MPARNAGLCRLLATAVVAAAMLFTAGCASYQLGSPAEAPFQSVFIPPVANDTFVPQSRAAVTTAIREAFARDGRVTLAESPAGADRIVEVRLADFSREMTSAVREDTALARKFALTLTAEVRLIDPASPGASAAPSQIAVSVDAFTDSGLQQSEFQAVPLLAGKLATEVVHRVLDTW
ncbi:MAG TPA: LPS assembly lipoprotein LptE [Opitutaceae bacterium]